MKKTYKIKITKKLINQLKSYWVEAHQAYNNLFGELNEIEAKMVKKTGIKEIEFFWVDNEIVGIGNADRTMPLIQREKLE